MNNRKQITRLTLSVAIAATLMSGTTMAQESGQTSTSATSKTATTKAAKASNATSLQQVLVTGTATYGGVKKIDASYSIVMANAEQIKEANPVSSADLLKMSPGVYPESSGGQTGANIEVAGFPGGGDAPYATFELNGSPLYPMSTLSFMENSSMFRLDDTIDRVEVIQGGPAVLYGTGQPGVTANFMLRQGTDVPSGDVGVTYGSEGMYRLDGFLGFKVADGWYGSVGGFWRKSDGVRAPQFAADDGGQLTATLSHDMDNGSLMFYARVLKDKNQFVTDSPILNPSPGKFSAYPGFDPLTGTFGSNANRHSFLETMPCTTAGCTPGGIAVDLADGRGANLRMAGANLDLDFGSGWSLSDKLHLTQGQMNTVSFFSTGANPTSLADYIAGEESALGLPAGLTATATYRNGGNANMNENVTTQGLWYVHKNIKSVTNEFHLSKELFDGNTLTFGNYTATYSAHDTWYLNDTMLLQAKTNPNPIVVSLNNGSNTYQLTNPQGFAPAAWYYPLHEDWTGLNTAFFLTDSWKVDRWLFDAGVRVEHQEANGRIQNNASGDLDGNPLTLYNNNAGYLINSYTDIPYSKSAPSWTIGANYRISDTMSVYARLNHGVHFPGFDDLRGNPTTPVQTIHNAEVGFKFQNDWIYADISAYARQFDGVPYTITSNTGQFSFVYGSDTKGVNFHTVVKPFEHFSVGLTGDFMNGHYTHNKDCVSYTAQNGSSQCTSINGMQLQRQPKFQVRVTPAYEVPADWGSMKFWFTYEYVGNRFGDQIQQQPLGHYYDLAIGATANIGQSWQLRLQGTNVTNQIGVTEGNARLFGFASTGGVILARSIQGREVNFQVKYKF